MRGVSESTTSAGTASLALTGHTGGPAPGWAGIVTAQLRIGRRPGSAVDPSI